MQLPKPLTQARLVRRYKRFLADMELDGGDVVTVHCANPGAMLGLVAPGARAWLSASDNPARKLKYSWEIVEAEFGAGPQLVGVNTMRPNAIVEEAVRTGFFPEFAGYDSLRREARYGKNSRVDILLEGGGLPPCYVEVKNVHMMRQPGLAEFPDSVTARGAKHLVELGDMAENGARAVMVYLIQMEAERFTLAADIDKKYAEAFWRAKARGVEAIAVVCSVGLDEIKAAARAPIVFAPPL